MSDLPQSSALLRRVAARLRLRSFCGRFYVAFLACCGIYAVVLLASRLFGLIPDRFEPETLLAIPAGALAAAFLWHRRPTPVDAARAVDRHGQTKDLFLTLALLDNSPGEYKPLVARDAESRAPRIKPDDVVPFRTGNRLVVAGLTAGILFGGISWLPQFDPFGKVEAAVKKQELRKELEDSKRATALRAAELKRDDSEGEESEEVKKAIEEFKSQLKKMKPLDKKGNLNKLVGTQKELGKKWRKISAAKLKDLLNQSANSQQFGGAEKDKLDKWTRELQEGSTESLQQEIEELKQDLQRLLKEKDPLKRAEMAQRIKKKLSDLEEFASERVNSKPLSAALKRAMKQLEMGKLDEGLSSEALEAVAKSLDLSKMELQEIAQSAKDLKALEEALKVAQMAKKLNNEEKLNGEACQNCMTLADYKELFAAMGGDPNQTGEGPPGERGMGNGSKVEEDDSVETDFKTEQSKSAVRAGKVLLSMKTKGLSDTGEAIKDYRQLVGEVKQGVSEAILQEKIPPGYHEGIREYFDSIEAAAPPTESPEN